MREHYAIFYSTITVGWCLVVLELTHVLHTHFIYNKSCYLIYKVYKSSHTIYSMLGCWMMMMISYSINSKNSKYTYSTYSSYSKTKNTFLLVNNLNFTFYFLKLVLKLQGGIPLWNFLWNFITRGSPQCHLYKISLIHIIFLLKIFFTFTLWK